MNRSASSASVKPTAHITPADGNRDFRFVSFPSALGARRAHAYAVGDGPHVVRTGLVGIPQHIHALCDRRRDHACCGLCGRPSGSGEPGGVRGDRPRGGRLRLVATPPSGGLITTLTQNSTLSRDFSTELSVPRGDSFGYLLHQFTANDSFDWLGTQAYGVAIDQGSLGSDPESYIEASIHLLEGDRARWAVTGLRAGPAEGEWGVFLTGEDAAPLILVVIITHASEPGSLRLSLLTSQTPSLPESTMASQWMGSGEAALSYHIEVGTPTESVLLSHRIESRSLGPSSGLPASVGELALKSRHPTTGPHLELSTSMVIPTIGAGRAEVEWEAAGDTASGSTTVALAIAAGRFAAHVVVGETSGASATTLLTTGASAMPRVRLTHSSIPFDLTQFGVEEPTQVLLPNDDLPVRAGSVCGGVMGMASSFTPCRAIRADAP